MQPTQVPQHPFLEIGRLRMPGPVVPSVLVVLPFVLPRRIQMRLLTALNTPLESLATTLTSATRLPTSMMGPRIRVCIKCVSVTITSMILQCAGWILSSLIFSCFRWRWFFLGQDSRSPALTVFSSAGGALFFPVLALIKLIRLLQARGPIGDAYVFVQKELQDCLVAMWWISCTYLSLWLGLEMNLCLS
jgi:hypothetical protein